MAWPTLPMALAAGSPANGGSQIMKDSRIGTYGAIALLMALMLKVTSLAALDVTTAATALIAGHAAARFAPIVALASMSYAGDAEAAKVKPMATAISERELALSFALALAPALLLDPTCFMLALVGGAVPAVLVAAQAKRLIGGYTGDILGAMEQVFEIGFLLAVVAGGLHNH